MKYISFDENVGITISVPNDKNKHVLNVRYKTEPFEYYTFSYLHDHTGDLYLPFIVAGMSKKEARKLISDRDVPTSKTDKHVVIGYPSMTEIRSVLEIVDDELKKRNDVESTNTQNMHKYIYFSLEDDKYMMTDPRTGKKSRCSFYHHTGHRISVDVEDGNDKSDLFFLTAQILGYKTVDVMEERFRAMEGGPCLIKKADAIYAHRCRVPTWNYYDYLKIIDMMLTNRFGLGQSEMTDNIDGNQETQSGKPHRLAGHVRLEFE